MAADTETVTEEEHEDDDKEVKAEGSYGKHGKKDEDDPMEEGVFDANHYCIHHGGVHHNGSIEMAEAVKHADPDARGHVSHYDMKLADGTILENVAAEDIQVTNATLAQEHMHKRDDAKEDEEDVQAEGGRADRDHEQNRRNTERTRPKQEAVASDDDVVEEAADEEDDKLEETLRRLVSDTLAKIRNS